MRRRRGLLVISVGDMDKFMITLSGSFYDARLLPLCGSSFKQIQDVITKDSQVVKR